MQNAESLEEDYRQCLEALAQANAREDVLRRRIIRLLIFTIIALIGWAVYFAHCYQIKIISK